MRNRSSNFFWGILLLAAAAFVLINQFNGFTSFGTGRIIAAILALVFFVQCIANVNFAALPIPLAVWYFVFQPRCDLPYIQPKILVFAAVLAVIGLSILLPRRYKHHNHGEYSRSGDHHPQMRTDYGNYDNNPVINVNFGSLSRRLHADGLKTVQLQCNFGALEIFFDQVDINPDGAEVMLNCSFGAIKLFIPKHWHVIDRIKCSLGSVDIDKSFTAPEEYAPQLTLSGSVSLGGIEIRFL